jgi:hypothetical protein
MGGGDVVAITPMPSSNLDEALAALRKDLISENGPEISTMRNYRFAIVPYRPSEEFAIRLKIRQLSDTLKAEGWNVLTVSLHALLMKRIGSMGDAATSSLVAFERQLYSKNPERALQYIKDKILPYVEGPQGIADDVAKLIVHFADQHPDEAERSLVFVGRAGALYPFFRTSALLKHIDGKTRNIPVVLLYPGERRDLNALSLMGELAADHDYRPRIYP